MTSTRKAVGPVSIAGYLCFDDGMQPPDQQQQQRSRELIIGLVLSLGIGIVVSVIGFIGTVVYLLTSGHLHAANRSAASLYLIAPGLGIAVAASGCAVTLHKWLLAARTGNRRGGGE